MLLSFHFEKYNQTFFLLWFVFFFSFNFIPIILGKDKLYIYYIIYIRLKFKEHNKFDMYKKN